MIAGGRGVSRAKSGEARTPHSLRVPIIRPECPIVIGLAGRQLAAKKVAPFLRHLMTGDGLTVIGGYLTGINEGAVGQWPALIEVYFTSQGRMNPCYRDGQAVSAGY